MNFVGARCCEDCIHPCLVFLGVGMWVPKLLTILFLSCIVVANNRYLYIYIYVNVYNIFSLFQRSHLQKQGTQTKNN